jgi:hypothetical protein
LGNTFGNLNEDKILGTLRQVMRPGDILVVSLEFGAVDGDRNPLGPMLEQYRRSHAARHIAAVPLAYLDGEKSAIDIEATRNDRRFSKLSHTETIYAQATVNGRNVITLFSNRYDFNELVSHFEVRGFRFVDTHFAMNSKFYRYVIFRS